MRNILVSAALFGLACSGASAQQRNIAREPIIDVHMHASAMSTLGGAVVNCLDPIQEFRPRDGAEKYGVNDVRSLCPKPVTSSTSDATYQAAMLKLLDDLNLIGVLSGPIDRVQEWRSKAKDPSRIIPSMNVSMPGTPSLSDLRAALTSGRARVIGETSPQYQGIPVDHPSMEPYFALAEELDVPIGVHMGLGAPAAAYVGQPNYLASLSNPLMLEPVLRRHPRLRIYVMHAGWPQLDSMVAMMYSHPQIYVDTGIIDWGIPRKEFHTYLKRLVEAGFGNRIMFGSDQYLWPEALQAAIDGVQSADFLTPKQKRDIFYNNAARFFRIGDGATWAPPK